MKIFSEISLSDFEFWSGAKDRVKYLTKHELDTIESILEDAYPEGLSETQINDLFWFDDDLVAEWLGYNNFDEIIKRDDEEGIIEDDDDDITSEKPWDYGKHFD